MKLKRKQTEPENGTGSTKTSPDLGPIPFTSLDQTLLRKSCLLTTRDLLLDTYIEIDTTRNFDLLLRDPKNPDNISEDTLKQIWESIQMEYSELIETKKTKAIFEAWKKVKEYEVKEKIGALSVYILRIGYDPTVANDLFLMGYDLIEPQESDADYQKQVDRVEIELKNIRTLLDGYIKSYETLVADSNLNLEGPAREAKDYEGDLAELSKFMGYRVDKKIISLFEYAALLNLYIVHSEKMQETNGKEKR